MDGMGFGWNWDWYGWLSWVVGSLRVPFGANQRYLEKGHFVAPEDQKIVF